jgi:excisionase family DNA binding protein
MKPQSKTSAPMTCKELADLVGVNPQTIHNWINDGLLHPGRFGNMLSFSAADIEVARRIATERSALPRRDRNPYDPADRPDDQYMTINEAAAHIAVTSRTIHRLIDRRELSPFRRGGQTVVLLRAEVEAIATKRATLSSAAYSGSDEREAGAEARG